MELLGRTLGQYRVIEELGRGGMGVVYRAEDLRLGRQVALKALPPDVALDAARVERFRREARSLASLSHPSIVTLYAIEEIGGQLLLAMELVEGKTLDQVIPARGFELDGFFRLALPLLDAVSAAHQQGIIHRDLKPGNVMLTPEGRIKVLDFGLAKLQGDAAVPDASQRVTETELTAAGAVIGTAPYMAPEQIRGSSADERSDLFSLGVILYQMAAGRHPFKAESGADLLSSMLRDDPPSLVTLKPGLPRHLDRILRGALEKDPERRFQSAKELRNQLARLEEEVRTGTPPEAEPPQPEPSARKVRWHPAAAVAVLLLVVAGLVLGLWSFRQRRPPAPPSRLPHLGVAELRRFSGEVGPEYYRSGLVAALAERLTGLRGVWVLPPRAADPLPDLLVEADARRLSDAVTLQLRVRDRQSHATLGSEVLEGDAGRPYDLLDRAGAAVEVLLRAQAGLPVRYRAGPVPTQDAAAFDLFLQAQGAGGGGPPDSEGALALLQRATEADPRFAPAWALAGEVHRRRYLEAGAPESLDEAAEACRRAVEIDPRLAAAHRCLAGVHQALQRPLEAQEEYVRAIELQPTSLDAYLELRQVFRELGLPETAERTWQKIIDLHPGYWAGHRALGGFYYDSERWAAAADSYRKALELAPENAVVQRELGAASHLLGRYEEAIIAYQKSIDLRPDWTTYANLGDLYRLLRRFPEAVESAERSVEFPEATHVAFGILGKAYYWAPGRRPEAAAAFERAAALCREHLGREPEDADAWLWLAYDLAMLERRQESHVALGEALGRRPNNAHYSYVAALIHNRLGEREESLARLERAVAGGYGRAEMRISVEFDNLRDEPRFEALLAGE